MDSRDKQPKYDINKVDFEWIEQQTSAKELHKAYEALKEDGGYVHLEKALVDKLKSLDPAFKRRIESDKLTSEEQQILAEDLNSFFKEI